MTIILQSIIIVLLVTTILSLVTAFRAQKRNAEIEWEWRKQLGKTLTAAAQARRENHLEIMKQFKGQSYAGKFGEFDIHTDSSMPRGSVGMFTPTQEGKKSDVEAKEHETNK